jgi:predicted MPP superfamily phosphohydrolase
MIIYPRISHFLIMRLSIFLALPILFVASQVYWFGRINGQLKRWVGSPGLRRALAWGLLAIYGVLLVGYVRNWGSHLSPTHFTWKAALLDTPFGCWLFGSATGFLFFLVLYAISKFVMLFRTSFARQEDHPAQPPSPLTSSNDAPFRIGAMASPENVANASRRHFLERSVRTLSVTPFVVGAYGVFWGRLNLKITETTAKIPRLPSAFDGFRILQLSDLHIGPFMTAGEIRRYVEIANRLKADLIALTGDFVTWDPSTQFAVVEALSGLKAPFGIYGCLGNHEIYTHTEDSITRLFARQGVKILRLEAAPVETEGSAINLIGVDFQTDRPFGREGKAFVRRYLQGVKPLLRADTANILLSHNPNTFDRAADLGIDLSLAGHTHGGQVSLEFINKNLSPARLITRYVRGWFEKPGGKLYVNSGIGTIGLPIRFDAPPEITVYKLEKSA